MLYYIKKTWKNSFLTILCQVISYSIEVFAALASMKMLDGLLAQDTQLFLFGLVAHLGIGGFHRCENGLCGYTSGTFGTTKSRCLFLEKR